MKMLRHLRGQAKEYAQDKRRDALERMGKAIDTQAEELMLYGLSRACTSHEQGFSRQVNDLKEAIAELSLCLRVGYIPAMVMIPDKLVSVRRKLEMLGVDVECAVAVHEQKQGAAELYAAVNVTLVKMSRAEVAFVHCDGIERSPLTLGETVLYAMYYPELFHGRTAAVINPENPDTPIAVLWVYMVNEKPKYVLRAFTRGALPDMPFQIATCEVRVMR